MKTRIMSVVVVAGSLFIAAQASAASGKDVYEATCIACHGSGMLGAPKFGDKAAWAPRLATGTKTLHTSALKGKALMPAKGGNVNLPDADVIAAVDFMINHAQ